MLTRCDFDTLADQWTMLTKIQLVKLTYKSYKTIKRTRFVVNINMVIGTVEYLIAPLAGNAPVGDQPF